MRHAWTIAIKDLKLRVRDRSAFLIGIVAPFALAAIFSFVFNPIEEFDFTATYAVVDEDRGEVGALFVDTLHQFAVATGVEIVEVGSRAEAMELVDVEPFSDEEGADAAFVVPAGFSPAVQSEQPARLEVISNEGGFGAAVAVAVAERFASEMESARVAVATFEALGGADNRFAAGLRAIETPPPVDLEQLEVGDKQLNGTTFYAAGLAIFFLFFTVQFGVNGLLEERHDGTLARLLAAPFPRTAIIAGKALMAFILGLVSMTVLVVATSVLFGAEWGNPIGVLLLVVAGIIAALGIMAVVSGFAKTPEQATNYSAMIAVVLGFLGGTFFPVAQAGGILADLRYLTPHGWFMQGLGDLADGSVATVMPAVGAMMLFGLATGAIALLGMRRGLRI